MNNPIAIATKGKGTLGLIERASHIGRRYGLTPANMDRILTRFAQVLNRFQCGATFPITAAVLGRNGRVIEKYQDQGIEFAVHGYYHVDHQRLTLNEQENLFAWARLLFQKYQLACSGFRSPYLRWNENTRTALSHLGFLYDSSQAMTWDVTPLVETEAYRRAQQFYGAVSAADYPSLPQLTDDLVIIPYSLPDDEAIIERLKLQNAPVQTNVWRAILFKTHELGELFTLGLHPERIDLCEPYLIDTLLAAQALTPGVWIARLDEIACWWASRAKSTVEVIPQEGGRYQIDVQGPAGTNLLVRGVQLTSPAAAWDGKFQQVMSTKAEFRSERRPFIGLSPGSSPGLKSFLCQQGYLVELTEDEHTHSLYLNNPNFDRKDERPLLTLIEQGDFPLVRLGRWPNGHRSALCISGDIDALTLWDYGLRFLGR